jgi:hypothetical protein
MFFKVGPSRLAVKAKVPPDPTKLPHSLRERLRCCSVGLETHAVILVVVSSRFPVARRLWSIDRSKAGFAATSTPELAAKATLRARRVASGLSVIHEEPCDGAENLPQASQGTSTVLGRHDPQSELRSLFAKAILGAPKGFLFRLVKVVLVVGFLGGAQQVEDDASEFMGCSRDRLCFASSV